MVAKRQRLSRVVVGPVTATALNFVVNGGLIFHCPCPRAQIVTKASSCQSRARMVAC